MLVRRGALVALLALAFAPAAAAQGVVVRGDVAFADARTPAPAILVEVIDEAGALAARTLTDQSGQFIVELAPGVYAFRALRVGYRPTVVGSVAVPTAGTVRIVLEEVGVRIAAARITGEDICGIRSAMGGQVGTAWEEVRKALASSAAVPAASRSRAHVISWRSIRSGDGAGVAWQQFSVDSFRSRGPTANAPGGAMNYFGPDAESLTSDDFAATNCFGLVPSPPDRGSWLGIAFRPAHPGRKVVDVAGTFWIDTATAALRLLEYTFLGGTREHDLIEAGGRIEFDRLSTGEWLVRRWGLHLPRMLGDPGAPPPPGRGERPAPRAASRAQVVVVASGGSALAVPGPDRDLLPPPASALRVEVRTAGSGTPVPGASVELVESNLFATADSTGIATIPNVPPRRHTVIASTAAMRAMWVASTRTEIVVAGGASAQLRLDVPRDQQLFAERCGRDESLRNTAAVYGTSPPPELKTHSSNVFGVTWLLDADRGSMRDAAWTADSLALATGGPFSPAAANGLSDEFGNWFVCGVPRDAWVRVVVRRPLGETVAVYYARIGSADQVVAGAPVPIDARSP